MLIQAEPLTRLIGAIFEKMDSEPWEAELVASQLAASKMGFFTMVSVWSPPMCSISAQAF